MVGYGPKQAPDFSILMMQAMAGKGCAPQFLYTHPDPDPASRISYIQRDIPKAMEYFSAAK